MMQVKIGKKRERVSGRGKQNNSMGFFNKQKVGV